MKNFQVEYKKVNSEQLLRFDMFGMMFVKNKQTQGVSSVDVKLQGLQVVDFLFKYRNPSYQYIISSYDQQPDSKESLFELCFTKAQNTVEIQVDISRIFCNWKADSILAVMEVLKVFKKDTLL